jgi:hypothetical protein
MKQRLLKIMLLSLLLIQSFISASTQSVEQEEIDEETAKDLISVVNDDRMAAWSSDSNTILSMISGLRNLYKNDSNDSELQREHKEKLRKQKHTEEFNRIKKEYYNKPFTLKAVMVKDVQPEVRLTREGQRRLKKVEAAIKSGDRYADYLAVQFDKERYKYEVETGAYEIIFTIPVPGTDGYSRYNTGIQKSGSTDQKSDAVEERFLVTVILVVKSRETALKYSKEEVVPVSGKITGIKHGYSFMDEYVIINWLSRF